jgi:nicotinamidase-related amidase
MFSNLSLAAMGVGFFTSTFGIIAVSSLAVFIGSLGYNLYNVFTTDDKEKRQSYIFNSAINLVGLIALIGALFLPLVLPTLFLLPVILSVVAFGSLASVVTLNILKGEKDPLLSSNINDASLHNSESKLQDLKAKPISPPPSYAEFLKTKGHAFIDLQNDFTQSKGALYVTGAELKIKNIVAEIYNCVNLEEVMLFSMDFHSAKNYSLLEQGGVFPPHCIRGTWGAELDPEIEKALIDSGAIQKGLVHIFLKGYSDEKPKAKGLDFSIRNAEFVWTPPVDAKSIDYAKMDQECEEVNFDNYVNNNLPSIDTWDVCGFATDFCVEESAIGFLDMNNKNRVIIDPSRTQGCLFEKDGEGKLKLDNGKPIQSEVSKKDALLNERLNSFAKSQEYIGKIEIVAATQSNTQAMSMQV